MSFEFFWIQWEVDFLKISLCDNLSYGLEDLHKVDHPPLPISLQPFFHFFGTVDKKSWNFLFLQLERVLCFCRRSHYSLIGFSKLRYTRTHPWKLRFWLIVIDIGHTSKVPYYDTYLRLFTQFFSKKFVTYFEKIRHFIGFTLISQKRQKITNPQTSGPRENIYYHKNSHKQK